MTDLAGLLIWGGRISAGTALVWVILTSFTYTRAHGFPDLPDACLLLAVGGSIAVSVGEWMRRKANEGAERLPKE